MDLVDLIGQVLIPQKARTSQTCWFNVLQRCRNLMSCNEFAFQTTSTDRAHLSEEVHQGTRTWPLLSRHLQELVGVAGQRHDRSVAWACDEGNGGSTRLRPRRLPSPATMSRRLDGVGVGLLCRCLQERLR